MSSLMRVPRAGAGNMQWVQEWWAPARPQEAVMLDLLAQSEWSGSLRRSTMRPPTPSGPAHRLVTKVRLMTYCIGIKLDSGLVFMSDSRTNAGIDQISTFR